MLEILSSITSTFQVVQCFSLWPHTKTNDIPIPSGVCCILPWLANISMLLINIINCAHCSILFTLTWHLSLCKKRLSLSSSSRRKEKSSLSPQRKPPRIKQHINTHTPQQGGKHTHTYTLKYIPSPRAPSGRSYEYSWLQSRREVPWTNMEMYHMLMWLLRTGRY